MSKTVNSDPPRATSPYVHDKAAVSATKGAETITADLKASASIPTITNSEIANRLVKFDSVPSFMSWLTSSSETTE